jgi:hypothetical protein
MEKEIRFESLKDKPITFEEYAGRMGHFNKIVVKYPRYEEVINELSEIHQLSKHSEFSNNLCIIGYSGVGKTTVIKDFIAQFPKKVLNDRDILPVLYLRVSSQGKVKSLASSILQELGDPFFNKGTEDQMTLRINNMIIEYGVEMIILDEFEHFINLHNGKIESDTISWLISFIQEIKIPVVLSGLPVVERILNWSSKMDRRFSNRLKMKPFNFETIKEQLEFKIFLKSIDDELPFFNRSKLEEPQIASLIHNATKGIPSYIKELLSIATKMSLKAGKDSITKVEIEYVIKTFMDDKFKNQGL